MITAGTVLVAGAVAEKASRLVAPDEPIEIRGPRPRFVGRGGEKLDAGDRKAPMYSPTVWLPAIAWFL